MRVISRLMRDDAGATAIEYGLIAALIAVAAITAMQGLSSQLTATFNTASSAMSGPAAYLKRMATTMRYGCAATAKMWCWN